jgi:hypothetical protein
MDPPTRSTIDVAVIVSSLVEVLYVSALEAAEQLPIETAVGDADPPVALAMRVSAA